MTQRSSVLSHRPSSCFTLLNGKVSNMRVERKTCVRVKIACKLPLLGMEVYVRATLKMRIPLTKDHTHSRITNLLGGLC